MSKLVVLDPGHGGNDAGAVGVDGLKEKDVNLSVCLKVKDKLEFNSVNVKMTRDKDITQSLADKVNIEKSVKANCFVSVHCNAYNKSAKGVETYSHTSYTSDLASKVHKAIINSNAYTLDRGVKSNTYYVLKNTRSRACLVELGFIDAREDVKILKDMQEELSSAIARGICDYLGIEYKSKPINKPPVNDTMYRVCVGSYSDKANAEKVLKEAKEKGFKDAFIVAK